MSPKPDVKEMHLIRDLETLKVISDPFRIDIIRLIHEANMKGRFCTVKEISEVLDLPSTKLYYHINLLEKHGLIVVGDTQIVSGIIEKQYQIVAENITVDPEILTTSDITENEKLEYMLDSVRSFLDGTYLDVKRGLTQSFTEKSEDKEKDSSFVMYTKSTFYLSKAQIDEMSKAIKEIEKKYDEISKKNFKEDIESKTYGLSIIIAPHSQKSPADGETENTSND